MQEIDTKRTLEENKRASAAFYISLATAILLVLSAGIPNIMNPQGVNPLNILMVSITIFCAIISTFASRRGQVTMGILLLITSLLALVVARLFMVKGLALPTGITALVVITGIALYTLPALWFGRTLIVSFAIVVASMVIDQFTVGVPASSSSSTTTVTLISVLFGLIYFALIAIRFNTFTLRVKFIVGLVALAVVPLLIIGAISYSNTRGIVQAQVKSDLRETSFRNSALLENFVDTQTGIMRTESGLTDIVQYLEAPRYKVLGSDQEAETLANLYTLIRKDQIFIFSYGLIDRNGINVLDTDKRNIGRNLSQEEFFNGPLNQQQQYVSGVLIDPITLQPTIYFSTPIISGNGRSVGVLLVKYDAAIIQSLLRIAEKSRSAGSEYSFVLDDNSFVNLAHTSHPEIIFTTYRDLTESELMDLQQKELIKAGSVDTLVHPQPELVAQLQNMDATKEFSIRAWESNGELTEMAAARIPNTSWILVTAEPQSAITLLTQSQTRATIIYIVLIIVFTIIIAFIVSRLFTNPILNITKAAEKISQGDFSSRAKVETDDEIGILANTFNSMSSQIQELVSGLETRVGQRTFELEAATKQTQKKAQELQAVTEIARFISTENDLEKLLTLVTITMSERFGFYHVGIFLVDEGRKYAVLRAANSDGGQVMLKRNHKLEVGQVGIVGFVTATGNPRIALDTGIDAVFFNNPDLPNTRSEMALPLTVRGVVTGALDVQSTQSNAFTQDDVSILSLLADQVAIAIENTRLLEETQNALAESQSIYSEYVTNAWQKKSTGAVSGYHLSTTGGRIINDSSHPINNNGSAEHNDVSVPIRVREQVIGALNIRSTNGQKNLSKAEINVVEAIADRLGLALDNARLFEETTSRASRERAVADITTKIRSTNDPQEMIRTALDELQQILGARKIEVVPGKPLQKTDT